MRIASSKSTLLTTWLSKYTNIAWASTHKMKLEEVQSKQKHALRLIINQSKTSPSEPLFLSSNVLNVC